MTSSAERCVSQSLRAILCDVPNGESIPDSEQFRTFLIGLECFLPEILQEIHSEWRYECLDGIYTSVAKKSTDREIEILGLCIIISDQTLTPLHVRIRIAKEDQEVSWLECRLGERCRNGTVRLPYDSNSISKRLYALEARTEQIDWVYKVTFGDRNR
jgi:hypothetical protein